MARAVITTGANMGDRARSLEEAKRMIAERAGDVVAHSSVRETPPWGQMEDGAGAFLNQLLVVETHLGPEELLDVLQGIERGLGRERCGGTAGRTAGGGTSGGTSGGMRGGAANDVGDGAAKGVVGVTKSGGTADGESDGETHRTAGGESDGETDGTADGGRIYLSRPIDIDIIFYGGAVMRTERLTIPHPLAAQREFVLALAAEIIPEYVHPASGATIADMFDKMKK